jgi:hypothetical protein
LFSSLCIRCYCQPLCHSQWTDFENWPHYHLIAHDVDPVDCCCLSRLCHESLRHWTSKYLWVNKSTMNEFIK